MVVLEPDYHSTKNNKKKQPNSSPSVPAVITISKKLINAVRLMAFVIQKISASPRKRTTTIVERGKIIGRSFNDLMLRHNTALGCSSHDVRLSFVSPRDYEFSCTSSPPHRPPRRHKRRGPPAYAYNHDPRGRRQHRRSGGQYYYWNDVVEVSRRTTTTTTTPTPLFTPRSNISACGGGDAEEGEFHVDKAAEEFIERFYRELMLQKWAAPRSEGSERFG